jgi:hypothetical protein
MTSGQLCDIPSQTDTQEACLDAPTLFSSSKPSMNDDILLDVICKVKTEWYELGLRFGQSVADLESHRNKSMRDNKLCCIEVFNCWINNGGCLPYYPHSWEGLYNALLKIGHCGTALEMKTKLTGHDHTRSS